MKVKSYKRGIEERTAYCCNCEWEEDGVTANVKARRHAELKGHQVDVYTENRTRIKPIREVIEVLKKDI